MWREMMQKLKITSVINHHRAQVLDNDVINRGLFSTGRAFSDKGVRTWGKVRQWAPSYPCHWLNGRPPPRIGMLRPINQSRRAYDVRHLPPHDVGTKGTLHSRRRRAKPKCFGSWALLSPTSFCQPLVLGRPPEFWTSLGWRNHENAQLRLLWWVVR